ncbi:hypothetical protein Syun_029266 [Stephania yunnanensis]|uniref:Uncharacterized protein n=1 Tax=Stephania yunnanensis TaxID=152371 RepID=A0AAP0E8N4_9MAGN
MQMRDPLSLFPRIMSIRLQGMHFLEKWLLSWKEGECLLALESLSITHCSQLKTLPEELGNSTALKSLSVQWCNSLVSVPQELQKLSSLGSLSIHYCSGLKSLPKLHLMSSLKELIIERCPELSFVIDGLLNLTSLEKLWIEGCPRLVIPKGELKLITDLRGPSILVHVNGKLYQ